MQNSGESTTASERTVPTPRSPARASAPTESPSTATAPLARDLGPSRVAPRGAWPTGRVEEPPDEREEEPEDERAGRGREGDKLSGKARQADEPLEDEATGEDDGADRREREPESDEQPTGPGGPRDALEFGRSVVGWGLAHRSGTSACW